MRAFVFFKFRKQAHVFGDSRRRGVARHYKSSLFHIALSHAKIEPMPTPGKRWYHITFGTLNSWLPGDPRGFRSRNHKIHSSGDQKNPPPKGEHAGLHAYSRSVSGSPVLLPKPLRQSIGDRVVSSLTQHGDRILVISVSAMHVHLLAELSSDAVQTKLVIGNAKKSASQAIGDALPSRVWSRDCGIKPIRDEEHHRNTYLYIEKHALEGAFVWTYRDGTDSSG